MYNQPKLTIIYKVVHVLYDNLNEPYYTSACTTGPRRLNYKLNEITHKPATGGPLFVFKTLRDAQSFRRYIGETRKHYRILKCEAYDVNDKVKIYDKPDFTFSAVSNFDFENIRLFIPSPKSWVIKSKLMKVQGCLWCDSLKPIELID